jgi:hypothetical protein
MKFTSTVLALSAITAVSAVSCSSSNFAAGGADVAGNIEAAIPLFCGSPAGQDSDIDLVTSRDGFSLLFGAGNSVNVKFFASGPRNTFNHCAASLKEIAERCTTNSLKYGRTTTQGEYYSITVLKGNSNDVWL